MSEAKGKWAGRGRRAARGKGVAKRRKPKAKVAKPVARGGRAVAPKKGAKPPAAKPAATLVTPAVPKAVPTVEKRKEGAMAKELTPDQFLAQVLPPQYTRETGHMCWDCKHFKPVIKGSKFPPGDTIGWGAQIHLPLHRCAPGVTAAQKSYAF